MVYYASNSMGFITVATEAVDLLCFVVMAALQMQLGRLFTADWYAIHSSLM